jgi:hypothetical protein
VTTTDFAAGNNDANRDDSRAAIVAAAELVRAWIYTQKAGWSETSRPYRDLTARNITPAAPLPSSADHVSDIDDASGAVSAPLVVDDVPDHFLDEAAASRRARITLPAISATLAPWLLRASLAAVVAIGVIGASWVLRAYWPKLRPAPNVGTAVLESEPPGAAVLIDGKNVGETPLTTELPVGKHIVDFRRQGVTRSIPIDVAKGRSTSTRIEWTVKRVGTLSVQSEPKGATVVLDGKERGATPITLDDLPVGAHALVLQSGAGTLKRTVTIAEDKTLEVKEAIFSGWLQLSSPIELQINDGKTSLRLDDRNQTLLKPGVHELRFSNKALGFVEVRKVEVKPGETLPVTIAPAPSLLSVTATEPSEVLIDGERVGATPLTDVPVAIGTRDVTVRSATDVRRKTITVTVEPTVLDIDFTKP